MKRSMTLFLMVNDRAERIKDVEEGHDVEHEEEYDVDHDDEDLSKVKVKGGRSGVLGKVFGGTNGGQWWKVFGALPGDLQPCQAFKASGSTWW